MVEALAQLTLLIQAWRKIDSLPEETQADVRAALGLPISQESVLACEPVRDVWVVAGQRIYQEERLRVQRSWLIGAITGRTALILDFAGGPSGFKHNLLAGTAVDAEVCFYPGAAPLRALIKAVHGPAQAPERLPAARPIAAAFEDFGSRSAANPWTEIQPAHLGAVAPAPGDPWLLTGADAAIPARADFPLLAVAAGRRVDVFGEWDGYRFLPLMVSADRRLVAL
jgi:hypothetical protein